MSLITGSPVGNLDEQESLYVSGAPEIYFQDYNATPLFNPDASGFYWGMSGTATYPVFGIGCPNDVSFTENLTSNDVLCDNAGVSNSIQQRNFVEFNFTIQTLFPLQTLRHILKAGTVTEVAPTQKMGIGEINNNLFYHLYTPKVYDSDVGDLVWMYFHKCRFVDAWTIAMPFGTNWKVTGIKLRAFADTSKPSTQYFGMMGRSDASVIV